MMHTVCTAHVLGLLCFALAETQGMSVAALMSTRVWKRNGNWV
jgi:hypothetical protein